MTQLANALRTALAADGLSVDLPIDSVGFVRLEVRSADDQTTIDLGTDARLRPPDRMAVGDVLSVEELGADKLLALFSRAQARDFVDVAALAERLGGIGRLCDLAAEKDPGFSRDVLVDMLNGFARFTAADFPGGQPQRDQLAHAVQDWRRALQIARQQPQPPERGLGR